jgi:putative (di)nucleoside polyphosphate hydrolase
VIDSNGFRANVGIIISNEKQELFWAKRLGQEAWQFPQGGVCENESTEETLYRELEEEVGLAPTDVQILGRTRGWLYYRLPRRLVRYETEPVCIGQKQRWFLLKLTSDPAKFRFDLGEKPEFDGFRWVSYWYPLRHVVPFKREVYRRALRELASQLFSDTNSATAVTRRSSLDPFRI